MDEIQSIEGVPADWMEVLQESREDVAAGRLVDARQVHANFQTRLAKEFASRRLAVKDTGD